MSVRLWTIFYVFALVAAALATFGAGGILVLAFVFGFWGGIFYLRVSRFAARKMAAVILGIGFLAGLMSSGLPTARGPAQLNQCMNNEKLIILGILNFESANGGFPPAFIADANGKPMHSWRVLILPYLGPKELALYRKYNFNEPWDGPNNSKLAAQIPDFYRCPGQIGAKNSEAMETNYFAIVDSTTGWPRDAGSRIREFRDGTSNTIMVVEAGGMNVNWMEPYDLSLDEAIELMSTKPNSGHRHIVDGFLTTTDFGSSSRNVAYCDGHIGYLGQFKDGSMPRSLLTVAGGEPIPAELGDEFRPVETKRVVKWRKVYALSVFVILALLPAAWVRPLKIEKGADRKELKKVSVSHTDGDAIR